MCGDVCEQWRRRDVGRSDAMRNQDRSMAKVLDA